jgi:DNA-binding MarR family transcriptional regulator
MRRSRTMPLRVIPRIHRATHQIGLHIARLSELGVTQAEAHILDHLASRGDSTVGEIHRAFGHRRSTLTSVLDRLSGRDLTIRDASAKDRRTFVIRLTSEGKAIATRLHGQLQRVEARVLSSVSAGDIKSFEAVLSALEQALGAGPKGE